jgi:SAM-dependent methyltransferase
MIEGESDLRQATIDTYNLAADALANYFDSIGPRQQDVDLAFKLAGNPKDARVLELGCGNGRDAAIIAAKSHWYVGLDSSDRLINIANQKLHEPGVDFEVSDIVNDDFPRNVDIIFAFASLLHLSKEEVASVMKKAQATLRPGGIFYISLKERSNYSSEIKRDEHGERLFYFYNSSLVCELAGDGFELAALNRERRGHTDWFEIALQKRL